MATQEMQPDTHKLQMHDSSRACLNLHCARETVCTGKFGDRNMYLILVIATFTRRLKCDRGKLNCGTVLGSQSRAKKH